MSKPSRNSDPNEIVSPTRTFFVTTKTAMGKRLLQSERNATLLIDVFRSNVVAKRFEIHDFVIMPDHIHILRSVGEDISIERTMQLIKGGFSYRLKKEFGYLGEVWQRGFSEVRVEDRESLLHHREYIAGNPVKAGLASSPEKFPFSFAHLAHQKLAAAKAGSETPASGTTESRALIQTNLEDDHTEEGISK